MKTRWFTAVVGAFAVALLGAFMFAPGGSASSHATHSAAGTRVLTHSVSAAQVRDTIRYWTPARMASAKPADIVHRGSLTPVSSTPQPSGPAGAVPGRSPIGRSGPALNPGGTGPAGSLMAFTYPFPFTRFGVSPASLYKTFPWEVNGKVFFTNGGSNFVCSGTSVVSPDGLLVWTAGHCVANETGTHQFDSFAEFVPAYNGAATNKTPKGVWVADRFTTTAAWLNNGDVSYDLGAMHVVAHSGVTLASTVGDAGFAWNQSRDQDFTDFGYPQAAPFNGNSMIECNAAHGGDATFSGGAGPALIGIGCDMTPGSSGGSWSIGWGGNTTKPKGLFVGFINAHNDYKFNAQPLAMYSPYFDDTANAVRCAQYGGAPC